MLVLSEAVSQEISLQKNLNDSIQGMARFQYYLSTKDTIYNGQFQFNSTRKNKGKPTFTSYNYQGNYVENQKEGDWLFSKKTFELQNDFKEKEYVVSAETSGEEFQINAMFQDGLAQGKWVVVNQRYKAAKPVDTTFTVQGFFEEGKMVKNLQAYSKNISIQGEFTENGLLDGNWEILHFNKGEELKEIRRYNKGVFEDHYFIHDNQTYQLLHIGLDTSYTTDENWVEFEMDEAYFQLIKFTNFGIQQPHTLGDEVSLISKKSNQFLKNVLRSFGYYKNLNVWSSLPGNKGVVYGKFKVRKFPFSAKESQQLNEIVNKALATETLLQEFFEDSQIEMGKLTFEKLNLYEAIFNQYQAIYPRLITLVNHVSNSAFEYVNRDELMPYFYTDFTFNSAVEYSYQKEKKIVTHPFPSLPSKQEFTLDSFYKFVDLLHKDVHEIQMEVNNILDDLSKQEALDEDEAALVTKKNTLEQLFNDKANKDNYNPYHAIVAKEVIAYAEELFEEYVKLPLDEKKNTIQSTLACYDRLIESYTRMADIPRKLERLDDVYTRTSFNPYLMVDMSERYKERLYKAFENYLLPTVLNKITTTVDCDLLPKNLSELDKIYNRMIELSEEDTSAMEKELRRERDAATIQEILFN